MIGHRVALGLYRAQTAADPRVELFDSDNGSLVSGMTFSEPAVDETYGPVQTITLQLLWQGAAKSIQDAINKAKKIQTLLKRGTGYLEKKGGNLPSSTDGTWHEGHAVTMTQFLNGLYQPVYWNVLSGNVQLADNYMDVRLTGGNLFGTITLTVQAQARDTQMVLDNLVACGDFAQPFSVYDPTFTAGWSYGNVFNWSVSTEQAWWGDRSLKALGSSSDGVATNSSTAFVPGDVLVPALMLRYAGTAPAFTNIAAVFQTSPDGSTWTNTTVVHIPDTVPISATYWTPIPFPAYTVPANGVTYVRLEVNINGMTAATQLYFDGVAIWRNPNNNRVPDEYVTGGYSLGMPQLNIYGVKGDSDTPLQLAVFPISNAYLGDTTYIGMYDLDTNADKPLYPLDLRASAPMLRDSFGTLVFGGVAESGHIYTIVQGTFGYAGGSLTSVSDANGDALYTGVGTQRYTASVYTAGTLNNATNYRIPQITIGIPGTTTAHQRIFLQNGNVTVQTWNDNNTQAGTTSAATTTADGTGYLLSVRRVYSAGVYKLTVSVNGTALISNYNFAPSSGIIAGGSVGLRLAKGGTPATAASWGGLTVTPEAGFANGPGEIPQIFSTSFMWGNYASQNVLNTTPSATFLFNNGASIGHVIDRIDRTYRAMAVFQSSAPSTAVGSLANSSVTVNSETANYLSFPNGATPAATNAGGFTIVDMGDFLFSRPGTMWQELTEALDSTRSSMIFTNTGLNSTGYGMFIAGVLLLPADQFAAVKSPNKTYGFLLLNDGLKAATGNYDINNFYNTGIRPEQYVPHDNMTLDGGELSLTPSLGQRTHFTAMTIVPVYTAPDATYYNDARTVYHAIVKYVPRYSLGVA